VFQSCVEEYWNESGTQLEPNWNQIVMCKDYTNFCCDSYLFPYSFGKLISTILLGLESIGQPWDG